MDRTSALAVACWLVVAGATPAGAAVGVGTTGHAGDVPAAATAQADCSFPVAFADATGAEVTVEAAPDRVVALGPSAAQTTWEIGAQGRVVGAPVNSFTGYLDGIESVTDVSGESPGAVDTEQVVNLTPDLVLAPNIVPNGTVSRLRDAGLTVYRFPAASSIRDVYEKTNRTGRLVGECDGAAATVDWMRGELATVREAVAGEEKPRVLFSMGGGFVAGNGTFVHELVETAGGDNVAANADVSGYRELSGEVVVQQDPEWIVQSGEFGTYPRTEAYNSTTAVQQGQVFTVNANYVSQPAPRIVYAVTNVTERLHPEAYEAALREPTTTETTAARPTTETAGTTTAGTTTAGTTATTETTTGSEAGTAATTNSGGQPGFGVGAGLVALVLAAVLVGRRR